MKRAVFVILVAIFAVLVFDSCETPMGSDKSNATNNPDNPDNPDNPVEPENPVEIPKEEVGGTYAEDFWGEWIRIDNGDAWYISGKKIEISGSVRAQPSNPVLTRQSSQVARVSESGKDPYYLFASRKPNASLRGRVIIMDNTPAASARAAGGGIGAIPPRIRISDPTQPEKPPVDSQPDSTGYIETPPEFIGGNSIEVTLPDFPDVPAITLPPLPIPPDNDPAYEPPVTPIPVVAEGVNLKASIRPQNTSEDATRLYADATSMDFFLEIENVGTEDCTAATYEIVYTGSDLIINDPAPNQRLGTLTPKEKGGSTYKKSIPLTITGKPFSGNLAFKDMEIGVRINDPIEGKTWNDSVAIRYNKAKIPFRIRSEYPVQGIIKVPGGKTHYFKTSDSSYGNCSYTIDLPWSTEDYFVIFSGATAATESAYSLGINTVPSQEFGSFNDTGIYEPNNDEENAVLIENSDSIMAYLHGGSRADIDYYRINLGNEAPVIKLVPLETYAFTDANGNADGTINPGESAYLDFAVKNETEQSRGITAGLSANGSNAAYVTIDKGSAEISSISPHYYASLTGSQNLSADNVALFVNYNLSRALKFSISESCPPNTSISLALDFSDSLGMTWSETLSLTIVEKNKDMVIAEPAADNCVLSEYSGNGDGHSNPGEIFYYDITVKNSGTGSVSGLQGVLTTADSNASIVASSANPGTLAAGASATARFRFSVSSSCPPGTVIPFTLTLTSSTGTIWELAPPAVTVKALAPSGLQAAAAGTDSVSLSWTPVSHAVAGYRVYYAASETGAYTVAGSTAGAASYTHTGRSPGTLYYYKASAFGSAGAGGESELSNAVSAKTWANLVFNKETGGTVATGLPDYYRFYVSNGEGYTFASSRDGAVAWESEGTSWFTLSSGTQSQTADRTGWAVIKFEGAGSYTLKVTSAEAALAGFVFDSTSPASTGTVNEADKTIAVIVPYSTSLASLTPVVTPASGWTCVTTGAEDFTGPVEYRFTKGDAVQVYAVTVTRRGQGEITITPPGGDISIAGFPAAPITVSRTGSHQTHAIQISDTSYASYEWYVDDTQKAADSGSGGRAFTIKAEEYPIGGHTVTLIVYKDGVPYSNEQRFTVAN
jgi:hypothetical protein